MKLWHNPPCIFLSRRLTKRSDNVVFTLRLLTTSGLLIARIITNMRNILGTTRNWTCFAPWTWRKGVVGLLSFLFFTASYITGTVYIDILKNVFIPQFDWGYQTGSIYLLQYAPHFHGEMCKCLKMSCKPTGSSVVATTVWWFNSSKPLLTGIW